jgi:hypothetical protein
VVLPSALRSRLALILLLGVFLIPVGMSSLRGLTHVLTCNEEAELPFTIIREPGQPAVILSSQTITRGDEEGVCGGLVLDLAVGNESTGKVELIVPLRNTSDTDWQGTVALQLGGASIPVPLRRIEAGGTARESLTVNVPSGTTELNGSVLIGP